jgi:hypothetical protein
METKLKTAFATARLRAADDPQPPRALRHQQQRSDPPNVDEWRAVDLAQRLADWENPGSRVNWPGCTFDTAATVDRSRAAAPSGWWDDVWGFVFESWDSIAGTYNQIVAMAAEVVAYAVPTCHSSQTCKDVIGALVRESLKSLGAPPTLPSTSQLIHDGKDYLASLAVSTAFGTLPNAGDAQWVVDLVRARPTGR